MKKQNVMNKCICWIAALVIVISSCSENERVIPDVPDAAYVRIFVDYDEFNTNTKYLYINGDFDSTRAIPLISTNGDPDQWVAASLPFYGVQSKYYNDSYYKYGTFSANPNYYPSFHDRVAVAPIVDNFNFYKWAKLPPGTLRLTFTNRILRQRDIEGGKPTIGLVLDQEVPVEKEKLYSIFLSRNETNTGYSLLTIPDKPAETPFKEGHCYIRFINNSSSSIVTQDLPDELDVYLFADRYDFGGTAANLKFYNHDTLVNYQYLGTISGKLKVDAPFMELPNIPDTAFQKNTNLRLDLELPNFRFFIYKKGDDQKKTVPILSMGSNYGAKPLGGGDATGVMPAQYYTSYGYLYMFDPLGGIHPTYSTVVLGLHGTSLNSRGISTTRYLWEPGDSNVGYRR